MKRFTNLGVSSGLLFGLTAFLAGTVASAQPAPAPPAPPAAPPGTETPAAPTEATPASEAAPAPPPAPPADAPAEAPAAEPAAAAPDAAPAAKPWYESIKFNAFVDGYAALNYNFPKPQSGKNAFRAYDANNGFSLAWAGLNASYDPDPVGGTISLRFGPSTTIYSGADNDSVGLKYLKQAFASWKPVSALQLDFGKFDTIYGAEVAESHLNQNYTRGVLYWLAQPLFHTGLRATYTVNEQVALKAMVVNGWNHTIDNNAGKSYGLQLALTPADGLAAYIGWIGGPEQDDTIHCDAGTAIDATTGQCAASTDPAATGGDVDRGGANDPKAWKHLVDLVVTYAVNDSVGLVFNADYGTEGLRSATSDEVTHVKWYGAMLGARYQIDPVWGVGVRGEYYMDKDGYTTATGIKDLALATGTLTIEAKPTANLILRLDTRGDFAVGGDTKEIFPKKTHDDPVKSQITSTLGVVVTTN
jgi:hypothetical protein